MKKLIEKILNFFMSADKKAALIFDKLKDGNGEKIVAGIDKVKEFLASKNTEEFVRWTKTKTDDVLLNKAKESIAAAMLEMGLAQKIISSADNYPLALSQVFAHISGVTEMGKGTWWREIAGLAAQILEDGKVDKKDLSIFVTWMVGIFLKVRNK